MSPFAIMPAFAEAYEAVGSARWRH